MKNKFSLLLLLAMFALLLTSGYAQNKVVKGTITDASGLPIPGANVIIKGTKTGTSTDFDGKYAINAAPGQVLVFSSTGSKAVEMTVGQNSELNVKLVDEISQLNEIVVVGYGTQKKSDLTGAISSVNAEELMNRPVPNALEALQGKVAGVDITTTERPGTVGAIRIRGQRSLSASSEVLYVVDGVPLLSASGIETLNPRDIETMDILKDASAAAIYGSRGANGVVIITTKQGKAGRFTLNYSGTVTTQDIVDRAPSMSASDFITFRRWAAYNLDPTKYAHPDSPTFANDNDIFDSALDGQTSRDNVLKGWVNGTWDASKVTNTDWTDVVTQTGITTEHVLSASGGSEKVNTYGSIGYLDNTGTQKGQWYKRYTAKLTSNITPVSWFKMTASLNASWSEQDYGMSTLSARSGTAPNAIYGAAKQIYNIAVPYDADGNIIINPGGESGVYTIMDEWNRSTQESQTLRLLGNFSANLDFGKIWKPIEGLTYKINFGPDFRHWREGVYIDGSSALKVNSNGASGVNFARLQNRRDLSWTLDNIISYDRTFANRHKVGVTLLQTASAWDIENSAMSANNIPKPSFLWDAMGSVDPLVASNNARMSSDIEKRQLTSYMARFNYGYDNRYLLTLSGRWDGASMLAEGNHWEFFPSAALAWRLNNESFLKDVSWIENLKLRVGFGSIGNSSVGPYSTLGPISQVFLPFNGMSNQIAFTPNEPYYTNTQSGMPNPNLSWERTKQYNLGIDFSFLNNRISGSIETYQSYTDKLLLNVKILPITGYPFITSNIGKTENQGVELTLNVIPIQTAGGFTWESNLNGAWQKDEIAELANGKQDMVSNSWFIGESIAVRYGYDNLGLWQDTPEDLAEMAIWNANGEKFSPGKVRPKDQNGDYKMTPDDRVVLGNSNPNWTMGWNNNFTYKGFELGVNIYGRMGYTASLGGEALTAHANQRETDYWRPDNTDAEFQKPILGQATSGSQDAYSGLLGFTKASFVKIRNISLGYNLPKDFTGKIGLANMKIYAQAVNPGSIYQSLDWYDFDTNATYFNRSFVMGIDVGF
ncbi:SusC/RagA family TonB-linked outer membrane protein [Flavobacterium sp. GA093]|uniref:SusC/RagA family TonB-linked outer membrane protein n=1 Tax=Flavobacterium hydrocarbonoxydans TaxID=2683249 RepID=A0A6I4NQU8_9FLAO|nr:TonB-dependent receptor [Flavobacterium hydrocarbonoxydans]MWB94059.1 SusC/RagA family TonB-linked outer membrane protein [Flavobacterium hydrocarbonoxydans]